MLKGGQRECLDFKMANKVDDLSCKNRRRGDLRGFSSGGYDSPLDSSKKIKVIPGKRSLKLGTRR